jgi:hypothetical protein
MATELNRVYKRGLQELCVSKIILFKHKRSRFATAKTSNSQARESSDLYRPNPAALQMSVSTDVADALSYCTCMLCDDAEQAH